ncbi:MAG: hypothetical protein KIG36_02890 [Eubacteriales bacterium]|nr:hypothetical protein [Eubacteriales bacterium]
MTAQELYRTALALLGEPDERNTIHQALPLINLVTAENLSLNNRLRLRAGREELTVMPVLTDLSETLPTEEGLNRPALGYALAARLSLNECDITRAHYLHELYTLCLRDLSFFRAESIRDVYGEG